MKVRCLPGTNTIVEENWFYAGSGERGRNYAPAVLEWDPETLNLIREEYWQGGLHSPNSGTIPAITEYDPLTGEVTKRVWMRVHEKHRANDLPAVEFIKNGKPVRHEYWVDGELRRDDGPPIVNFDPETGEIASTANQLDTERQIIPKPAPQIPSP